MAQLFVDEAGKLRMKHEAFSRPVVIYGVQESGWVFRTAYVWGHP